MGTTNRQVLQESYLAATDGELVELTVGRLLEQVAGRVPDRVALIGSRDGAEAQYTYAELLTEARRAARGIGALAGPGEMVALWAPNVVDWPIIEYGVALAGVVLVALNPVLRRPELEYALWHSGATVLLHADRSRDYDMAAVVGEIAASFPDVRAISLSDRAAWLSEDGSADPAREPTDPRAPVMLQYTSGTTGNPKGVLLSHRALVNVSRLTMQALDVPDGPVAVNPLPMFHTAACVIGTIGTMCVGGTEVLIEQFAPGPVLERMRSTHATVLYYVPAVLGALLEAQRGSDRPAAQLSTILGGGANVPAAWIEAAEELFGSSVYNLFGQTELAPVLSLTRPGDSRDDQLRSVGFPLPQIAVKIADPATGAVLPVGEEGEICARGFNRLIEYLHDPDATSRAVDADGFVHTGDLGRVDERGYLYVTGRLKEMIIRGAENIAPAEIESALARHDRLITASVVGLPDDRLGEIVAAVVQPRDGTAGLKDDLCGFLADRLSPFKIPTRWFVGDELPVTPTGKVRKFKLAEQITAGELEELGMTAQTIDDRRAALGARFPQWTPRTLDAWLDHCAEQYADRPLVITDDVTLTYRDVAEQSRRLADGLVALGVRPGDRVGMLLANYPEFVPLKFAIARTGAIAIPFNFLYQRAELAHVLAQSGCSVLVTMSGFANLDYLDMLDSIATGWDDGAADRTDREDGEVPDLRRVIVLSTDGRDRAGAMTFDDLGALGDAHASAHAGAVHEATDVGDMLYTSGSTGSPKGVLVTHDAVLRTAYASALTRAYEDGRRILFSLPCYHMFGYVEGLLSAMYVGGAVIMQTTFSPEGYFAGIEAHRATDILCVPTMAVAMVESPARERHDLSSLTAILCGSTTAPVWLWQRVERDFGVSEIVTGYGMTECGGAMTLTRPEDELILSSTTVGRPKMAGSASTDPSGEICVYRTADPVLGDPLPDGEEGELISRGPTTMVGFWEMPERTAEALRDGWLYSGDLGKVRPDGYLEVTGRSKELYKSGGELVMPKEIEELLSAREDVSQVFVVGVPDDRWGEVGCAVIVPSPGATIDEAEIIDYCRQHLARFKVPRQVLVLADAELPKTPTGKIQKFRLVERAAAQRKEQPA